VVQVLLELGADTSLHSNPCCRGKHCTPLELAHGGKHKRLVEICRRRSTSSTFDAFFFVIQEITNPCLGILITVSRVVCT